MPPIRVRAALAAVALLAFSTFVAPGSPPRRLSSLSAPVAVAPLPVASPELTVPWHPVRTSRSRGSHVLRSSSRRAHAAGGLNWLALANCESSNNPRANRHNKFFGLYQFNLSTWYSVGGHGNPMDAPRQEQTHRAYLLYLDRGRQPWPYCGRFL